MESKVRIRATLNEMNDFFDGCPDIGYSVKSFDASGTYKGNPNAEIIFNCVVKHPKINGELENRVYTFSELAQTVKEKRNFYE